MKYTQTLIGLLVGTALGGSVVAATGTAPAHTSSTSLDAEAIKKIVRETIVQEPELIIESVQKYQQSERDKEMKGSAEKLKDPAVRAALHNTETAASVGPKDSKRTVIEFFDYNCPACKMQYRALSEVLKNDKGVQVIFRELPIFGPVSDTNARLGLAVARVKPEAYLAFHEKMMTHQGKIDEKDTLAYIKAIGLDVEKVKAEAQSSAVKEAIEGNHALATTLRIQGTPSLVIGDELIPHAVDREELIQRLGK